MKLEILYSEICNLGADLMNVRYLRRCLPDAEFVYTGLSDTPAFAAEPVSFLYLGPMSEHSQEIVIDRLRPYRACLEQRIADGMVCLFTGNAMEVLFDRIENADGTAVQPLGLLPYTARRDMEHRYNDIFLGTFDPIAAPILGYRHQFTAIFGDNSAESLFRVQRGTGLNPQSALEGIRRNNFFGTSLLGGVLLLNPDFTQYLLGLIGGGTLAFEDDVRRMYQARRAEFEDPARFQPQ